MNAIWKFVTYFAVSLVSSIFLLDVVQNNFTRAFIISLIIALLIATKDG